MPPAGGREQPPERFYSFYQSVVDESAPREERPKAEPPGEVFRRGLEKARGAGLAAARGEATGESLLAEGRFEDSGPYCTRCNWRGAGTMPSEAVAEYLAGAQERAALRRFRSRFPHVTRNPHGKTR